MKARELAKKRQEKSLEQERLRQIEAMANTNLSPEERKRRLEELGITEHTIIQDEDIRDEDIKRSLATSLMSMIPFTNAWYEAAAAEEEMDDLIKILKEKNRADELFAQTKESGRELDALDELMCDTNYDFFYFNKLKTQMIEKGKYHPEEAMYRLNTFDSTNSAMGERNRLKLAINKTFYMTQDMPKWSSLGSNAPATTAPPSSDLSSSVMVIPTCGWKGKDSFGNLLHCTNPCRERGKGEVQKLLNVAMSGSGFFAYCSYHIPCCINPIHDEEEGHGDRAITRKPVQKPFAGESGLTGEESGRARITHPNKDSLCSECFMLVNKYKALTSKASTVPGVKIEIKEKKRKKEERETNKRGRLKRDSLRHSFSSMRGSFSSDIFSEGKSSVTGSVMNDVFDSSTVTPSLAAHSVNGSVTGGHESKHFSSSGQKPSKNTASLLAKREAEMNMKVVYTEETLKYPYHKKIKRKRRGKCFWKPTSLSELSYECNNKCMVSPNTGDLLIFCPFHIPFCLIAHGEGQSNDIQCPNPYGLCNLHHITIRGEAPKERAFPYPGMKKKEIKEKEKETYEEFLSRHFAVPRVPPPPLINQPIYVPRILSEEEKIIESKIRKERDKLIQLKGNLSAILIQKRMRGYLHREYLVKPIREISNRQTRHKAAIMIQTHVRRYQAAIFFWSKYRLESLCAIRIQAFIRGSLLHGFLLRMKSAVKIQKFMKNLHMFKFKDQVIKVMEVKRMYHLRIRIAIIIQKYFRRYRAICYVFSKRVWKILSNISSKKIQRAFRLYLVEKKRKFLISARDLQNIKKQKKIALFLARRLTDMYLMWRDHRDWWLRVGQMAPTAQRMIRGLLGRVSVHRIKLTQRALGDWLNVTEGLDIVSSLLSPPRDLECDFSPMTKALSFSLGLTQTMLCSDNSPLRISTNQASVSDAIVVPEEVGPISRFLPYKYQRSIEVKPKYFHYALELFYDKVIREPLLVSEKTQILQTFTSPLTGNIYIKALEAYAAQCKVPCQQHGRQICVVCVFRGRCQVPNCECECYETNGREMTDEERGLKKKLSERQKMINSLFNLSNPEDVELLKIITEEESIKQEAEAGKNPIPKGGTTKKKHLMPKKRTSQSTICSCCSHDRFSHLMHPLSSKKKLKNLLPDKYNVEKHYFQKKHKEVLSIVEGEKSPDISLPATIQGISIEDALLRPLNEDDMRDYMDTLNKEKTLKKREEINTLDNKNDIVKLLALGHVDGRIIKDHPVYWDEEKPVDKTRQNVISNGDMTELKEIITFTTLNEDDKYKKYNIEQLFSNTSLLKNHSREEYDQKFNNSLPLTIVRNGELVYTHQHDELYFNVLIDLIRIHEKGEEEYKAWLAKYSDHENFSQIPRPREGITEDNEELLLLIMNNIQIFERHWRKMIVDLRNGTLNSSLKLNSRKNNNQKFIQTGTEKSFVKTKKNNNKEILLFGPLPNVNSDENQEGISPENGKIYIETNYPRPELSKKLENVFLKLKFNLKSFGKDIKMELFAEKKDFVGVNQLSKNEISLRNTMKSSANGSPSKLGQRLDSSIIPSKPVEGGLTSSSQTVLLNEDQVRKNKDKKRRKSMPLERVSDLSSFESPSSSSSPVDLDFTLHVPRHVSQKDSQILEQPGSSSKNLNTQMISPSKTRETFTEDGRKADRRLLLKKLAKTFDNNRDVVEDLRMIGRDTETETLKNLKVVAPSLDTVTVTSKLNKVAPTKSLLKKRRGSHGDIMGVLNQVEVGDSYFQSATLPRKVENDLGSIIASATGKTVDVTTSTISSSAFIPISLQGLDKERYLELTGQTQEDDPKNQTVEGENTLGNAKILRAKNRFICPFPACGHSFLSEITCRQHILTNHENQPRLTASTPNSDYLLHYFWPKDAPWIGKNLNASTSLKKVIPPGSCQCKYLKCGEIFANKTQEEAHYKLVHGKISLASTKMNYIELLNDNATVGTPPIPIFTISPDPIPGPGFGLLFCRTHQAIVGSCLKCVEIESEMHKARMKAGSWRPSLNLENEYKKKLKKDKEIYEEGLPKPPYSIYSKVSIDLTLLNGAFPFPTHLLEASHPSTFTFSPLMSPMAKQSHNSSLRSSPFPRTTTNLKTSAKLLSNIHGTLNFPAKHFKKVTVSQMDSHLVLLFYSPKVDPVLKSKFVKGRVLYHLVDSDKTVWFGVEPLLLHEELHFLGYNSPSFVPPDRFINTNPTSSLYNIENVKAKNRFDTLIAPTIRENNTYQLYPLRLFECPSFASAFGEISHKLNPSVIRWFPAHAIIKAYRLHSYLLPINNKDNFISSSVEIEEPPERTFYVCYDL